MPESYTGTKFKTVFKKKQKINNENIPELDFWCKKFSGLGLAPAVSGGYAGNLSFRTSAGFIITAAGADLGSLSGKDFIELLDVCADKKTVFVKGLKEPSSESFLHHEIYMKKPGINAVFHGHDGLVLKHGIKLNLPVTKREQPYGSMELVKEVFEILNNFNYILMRNHGFLSLGKTMEEAGNAAVLNHRRAENIKSSFN